MPAGLGFGLRTASGAKTLFVHFDETNPNVPQNQLAVDVEVATLPMTPTWFLTYHDVPELIHRWLSGLGVRDPERAGHDLADLIRRAGPDCLELVAKIAVQLDAVLPRCADSGMALANLERFMAAVPRIETTLGELAANPRTTEILLQVFSTSQYLTEVLIRDPGLLDWLQGGADRRDRSTLIDDLWATVADLPDENGQRLALRRFRQCASLRIGYNDIVRRFPLELITLDLSDLADACVEAAVRLARQGRGTTGRTDDGAGLPGAVCRTRPGETGRPGAELQLRY